MKYNNIAEGEFIDRPNRFIANVKIGGESHRVHVKNTGRCRELLVPGARVYLEDFGTADDVTDDNGRPKNAGHRKTRFDLIGVEKQDLMINMDSQAPNKVAEEALRSGLLVIPELGPCPELIRREVTYGGSRFDLYAENGEEKAFIEVKGVTLERGGIALFPDAPTERGVKHIRELMAAKRNGYAAAVLFVIQMDPICEFRPNEETHPEFAAVLREAQNEGVHVLAYSCKVTPDTLELYRPVEVKL